MISPNGRHTSSDRQPSARAVAVRASSLPIRTMRKPMIARPATVASERKTRTSLGDSNRGATGSVRVDGVASELTLMRCGLGSEAQIDLTDDERRGADVDPVVVAV